MPSSTGGLPGPRITDSHNHRRRSDHGHDASSHRCNEGHAGSNGGMRRHWGSRHGKWCGCHRRAKQGKYLSTRRNIFSLCKSRTGHFDIDSVPVSLDIQR